MLTLKTTFDDGDALCEDLRIDGKLVGHIWTEGEDCGYQARAVSNVQGYWSAEVQTFQNRESALRALVHQANYEGRSFP